MKQHKCRLHVIATFARVVTHSVLYPKAHVFGSKKVNLSTSEFGVNAYRTYLLVVLIPHIAHFTPGLTTGFNCTECVEAEKIT